MTMVQPEVGPAATGGAAWAKTQPTPGRSSKGPLIAIGAGLAFVAVVGVAIAAWRFRASKHAAEPATISEDLPPAETVAAPPASTPAEPITEKPPVENDDPTTAATENADAGTTGGKGTTAKTVTGTKTATSPSAAKSTAKPPASAKGNDWGY
jgi:hypothetical protein